jgi:hypothetical protein
MVIRIIAKHEIWFYADPWENFCGLSKINAEKEPSVAYIPHYAIFT